MRIALLHYHLHKGGVASVIQGQTRSLLEAGHEVLVITGETAVTKSKKIASEHCDYAGADLAIVPGLRYDQRRATDHIDGAETASQLAAAIVDAMSRRWGSPADIVHVHNPLIRKNSLLLPALRELKDQGIRLLLHNHDFAEDYRPDVYTPREPYPEDSHYAVLNGRDYSFLRRAGLAQEGIHLLPNAVLPLSAEDGQKRTRYLYPVRAIRRKNIGEALLLSLFIPHGTTVAITLPPNSHRDFSSYRLWKETAERLRLPLEFELGEKDSLPRLLGSARCAITTSVKEGFGFSFLEPWTAFRAVIGRRLDYVCSDFEKAGVCFDGLYDSIDIPLVYLPAPLLRRKMEAALTSAYRAYQLEVPTYQIKMMTDVIFSRDMFDFGRLDEELQIEILETLCSNEAAKADLADANPFLAGLAEREFDDDVIADNRAKILDAYAPSAAALRLLTIYRHVMETTIHQRLSKSILLELFLDPPRLSLIGTVYD